MATRRALVGVKRVIDHAIKIRVKTDKSAVETENVKMAMNPFCEIAVEEGIRLKEKGVVSELVAVAIGCQKSQEVLRQALAMGADRAIHLKTSRRTDSDLTSLEVAKALAKVAADEQADVLIMGKQSIDDDRGHTGQMVAGLLDWPQATFCSSIEIGEDGQCKVSREVDEGTQLVEFPLPAVFTTDLRLNTPRFSTLPNLMKAKKKPLAAQDLPGSGEPYQQVHRVEDPPTRSAGVLVKDVDELLDKLRNEAKVL